eukprot:CAMPEP_0174954172 /NCGR_PEP_ID=MMETSP0004_2-20121128/276_1 /TAXON_ID=420556 /ORGANISM="Ochromonas sp., Strain CCMP1393" /LENGTH=133 /DNA_ID=CAMNT_0016201955 /DNA_START=53 /DNA_END=454 /DNA_ORIENTATION=+
MKLMEYLMNLLAITILAILRVGQASTEIHICEIDDPLFLGTYTATRENMDGVPIYSNANDMSIFRNKGFWYVGNLAPWPPETHYRCVEHDDCGYNENTPPGTVSGNWKASKKYDKGNQPVISLTPCAGTNEEL